MPPSTRLSGAYGGANSAVNIEHILEHFDQFKRKHITQNRDIIKTNALAQIRIRELETRIQGLEAERTEQCLAATRLRAALAQSEHAGQAAQRAWQALGRSLRVLCGGSQGGEQSMGLGLGDAAMYATEEYGAAELEPHRRPGMRVTLDPHALPAGIARSIARPPEARIADVQEEEEDGTWGAAPRQDAFQAAEYTSASESEAEYGAPVRRRFGAPVVTPSVRAATPSARRITVPATSSAALPPPTILDASGAPSPVHSPAFGIDESGRFAAPEHFAQADSASEDETVRLVDASAPLPSRGNRGAAAASSSRQSQAERKGRRSSRRQSGYQGAAELQLTSEDEGASDAAPSLRHKQSTESMSSCFDEEIMLSEDSDADTTLRQSAVAAPPPPTSAARKRKEPASPRAVEPAAPAPAEEEASGAPAGRTRRASSRSRGSTVNYALPKLNTKMRKPDPADRIPAPHSGDDERASSADEGDAAVRARKKGIGFAASSGDLSDIRKQHEDAAAQRDAAGEGEELDGGQDDSLAQLMSQESDAAAVRRLTPAIEQGPWRRASVAPRAARKAADAAIASYAETSDSEAEVRKPRQSKAKRQSHIAPTDDDSTPPAKASAAQAKRTEPEAPAEATPTAVVAAPAPRTSAAPTPAPGGRLSISSITLQDLGFSGIELSPLPVRTSTAALPKSSTMAPRSRSLSSGPLSRPSSLQGAAAKAPRERSASGNTALPERPRTFSGAPSKALANGSGAADGKQQRASLHAAMTTPNGAAKQRVPQSTGRAASSPTATSGRSNSSSASSSPMRKPANTKPAGATAAPVRAAPATKAPTAASS